MKVYIVTSHRNLHHDADIMKEKDVPFAERIQAGAACTDIRVAGLTDDIGDNVSIDNPQLCEMSAAYWIAHNDTYHDYVGLYHYTRWMDVDVSTMGGIIENGIDVVIPYPKLFMTQNKLFAESSIVDAFKRVYPKDMDAFMKYWNGFAFIRCNIFYCT